MKSLLFCGAVLSAIILTGCSQQAADSTLAGFTATSLGDSGQFAVKEGSLTGYESVYLESVTALPASGVTDENTSDVAALEFAFEQAFKSNFGNAWSIADGPGEKTLTATVRITQVVSRAPGFSPTANNPADLANSYGPGSGQGISPDFIQQQKRVAGTSMFVDRITTKVEFTNASGELLAQFTDKDFGADIECDSTGGTSIPRVTEAFSAWCSEISAQLAKAAGK